MSIGRRGRLYPFGDGSLRDPRPNPSGSLYKVGGEGPPPPGRADALLLCSVSPYPPRIRPLGPWVPAEPLSSFYKGRMTLAKAELLVGDFLARNVNIYFHPTAVV